MPGLPALQRRPSLSKTLLQDATPRLLTAEDGVAWRAVADGRSRVAKSIALQLAFI